MSAKTQSDHLARMLASGHLAGILLAHRGDVETVHCVRDDDDLYTGEIRYKVADRWWSVTPQVVAE